MTEAAGNRGDDGRGDYSDPRRPGAPVRSPAYTHHRYTRTETKHFNQARTLSGQHCSNLDGATLSERRQRNASRHERSFKKTFAENFRDFLRENFSNSVEAAAFFGKSGRCAEYWWEGAVGPSGPVVAKAFTTPALASSAHKHLREQE